MRRPALAPTFLGDGAAWLLLGTLAAGALGSAQAHSQDQQAVDAGVIADGEAASASPPADPPPSDADAGAVADAGHEGPDDDAVTNPGAEGAPVDAGPPTPPGDEAAPADPAAELTPIEGLGDIGDGTSIEDFGLEDLLETTVTAGKIELTLEEAPSIVEIITAQDIRERGYRTVGEALRHVPGLSIIDDHLYMSVGVRGVFGTTSSANDIVKVLVNGQPIAFRSSAVSFLEHDLVPVEAVERIEVLRGAASALYGANAFLGVINIITFKGDDDESTWRPHHSVALDGFYLQNPAASSFNGAASVTSGLAIGAFRYFVAGTLQRMDRSGLVVPGLQDIITDRLHREQPDLVGAPDRFPTPGWDEESRQSILQDPVSRNDIEIAGSLYGVAAYDLVKDLTLQLDGHLQSFDRAAEFQDFTFLSHRSRITHLNGFGRLQLESGAQRTEGLAYKLSAALASGAPTADERIVDRLLPGTFKRRHVGYRALDLVAEARYMFGPATSLAAGADYTWDDETLLTVERIDEETGEVTRQEPRSQAFHNAGVYAQWMWNPWDKLIVTLGSRADYNPVIACNANQWDCLFRQDDVVVPAHDEDDEDILVQDRGVLQMSNRAAVVYSFPWLGTYAKLIYGSSYKPPSPLQLYQNQLTITGSSGGNATLKPQTADTLEATVGMRPLLGLKGSVVGFFTTVNDVVMFLKEGGRLEPRNADLDVAGVEGSVSYALGRSLSLFANTTWLAYSSLRPRQESDETDFAWANSPFNASAPVGVYPPLSASAGVDIHAPEAFINVSIVGNFVSARRASVTNAQLYDRFHFDGGYELPPYATFDVIVSSVGLKLLGDAETVVSAAVLGAPGGYIEAGSGGIDIPALGPRVHLKVSQGF